MPAITDFSLRKRRKPDVSPLPKRKACRQSGKALPAGQESGKTF
jgi:hypothetical protein